MDRSMKPAPNLIAELMTGLFVITTTSAAAQVATEADSAGVPTILPERRIVISIPDRKLALIENESTRVYPVAVGKPSTPSPAGTFSVINRVVDPTYYHRGGTIPPGPSNPLGTRWMGLSEKGFGIHGTNNPGSIGKGASHGCFRMARRDLEELYELVHVGDTVVIHSEMNAETAAIFGHQEGALACN